MQYVRISSNTTLDQLRQLVGPANLETVLAINSLKRTPNIGMQVVQRAEEAVRSGRTVTLDFKIRSLSRASGDSDIFETMSMMGDSSWKVLQETGALPNTLLIPDGIVLPTSQNILGNSQKVSKTVFTLVMNGLNQPPHEINSEVFTKYFRQTIPRVAADTTISSVSEGPFQYFKIPWGKMSIHSSLSDSMKDFPVYPEEISENAKANYSTMPEIIYQYEPWQLYTGSGPRMQTYNFTFHRDMWTGDHRDGKANELVRFCMANCYPEYNGSLVNTATTTLYMNGNILMRGVLTDVNVTWDGPLGQDDFYLVCKLSLSIVEVSQYPLNYQSVMNKPLIG